MSIPTRLRERAQLRRSSWRSSRSGKLVCILFHVSPIVLPRPSQIVFTLVADLPALWPHILQTLVTTLIGFAFGVATGVVLGVTVGVSRAAYDAAYPLLVGFSSIPKVAVVPIFVLQKQKHGKRSNV